MTTPLDPAGFLTGDTRTLTFDAASQVQATGYAYDRRGRLTSSPGNAFTWDSASRLTGINGTTLAYNGLGWALLPKRGDATRPLTCSAAGDYNGHMIRTLRESKARLSELVERASRGEDVLITVRGRVKARLTRAGTSAQRADMRRWALELKNLQEKHSTGRVNLSIEQILREDRGE